MKVIDFHSHILPGLDDGSKDIHMTSAMLTEAKRQGIDVMVATPHFYGDSMKLETFLKDRREAFAAASEAAEQVGIQLYCGSEVAYFRGISRAEDIRQLCIRGTNLMMVEMPFHAWTGQELRELEALIHSGVRPIIAHLERFPYFQEDKSMIDQLLDLPVLIQVNAGPLLRWSNRRRPLRWLKEGQAHLLGSDAHNTSSRSVNLGPAREVIRKKLGQQTLDHIDSIGQRALTSAR